MRIPNSFLTDFKSASDLKLACVFYSLLHKNTVKNMLGCEVTVKQSTLASLCGCSVATVKRSVESLRRLGFIKSQKRLAVGENKLGTYLYTIVAVDRSCGYFTMERKLICRMSGQEFKVYAMFCKLADKHGEFFQSYSDLSHLLLMSKKEIIKAVNSLIRHKFIRKRVKKTHSGDFTDNTYIICQYVRHSKIGKKAKKIQPPTVKKGLHRCIDVDAFNTHKLNIHQFVSFVKCFFRKNLCRRKLFLDRGSG